MLVHQLYSGSPTGDVTGSNVNMNVNKTRTGLVQVRESAGGTSTIDIQGSLSGDTNEFVTVKTFSITTSTNEAAVVTLFPYMRVKISGVSSTPTTKVLIGE